MVRKNGVFSMGNRPCKRPVRGAPDWESIHISLEVIRKGSFRAAAEHLGTSINVLRRRVDELERNLGVKLLTRHVDGVRVTSEGEKIFEAAKKMEAASYELVKAGEQTNIHLSGEVRLAVTEGLGHLLDRALAGRISARQSQASGGPSLRHEIGGCVAAGGGRGDPDHPAHRARFAHGQAGPPAFHVLCIARVISRLSAVRKTWPIWSTIASWFSRMTMFSGANCTTGFSPEFPPATWLRCAPMSAARITGQSPRAAASACCPPMRNGSARLLSRSIWMRSMSISTSG